jgi:kojibiose phosphorylase
MINNIGFDPWRLIETEFNPDAQYHRETIFTIGNGYLSTRGTFEERYPQDRQATLVHGIWDDIPVAFTELVNAPDWTSLEVWINETRFSLSKGNLDNYFRRVDLRSGVLHRTLRWSLKEKGICVDLEFERFASLADPHILCLQLKITPLTSSVDSLIRASLDGHVENLGVLHWNLVSQTSTNDQANLIVKTRKTNKYLAMSTKIATEGGEPTRYASNCSGSPGIQIQTFLNRGDNFTLQKFVAIATSRDSHHPLQFAQEKLDLAYSTGYDVLKTKNQASWLDFWELSDVKIKGDEESQVAIRHALFQLRIAASISDEYVSIGAKTLSGFGYRGHVFWDTEIFVLPFFTFTQPIIARNMLMYRFHTLSGARRKASGNGYKGAQYAWESAETGDEVTPRWVPDYKNQLNLVRIWTGDIEIHITADIIYAMHQYWKITGDDAFWCQAGIPVLLETALFWGERVEAEKGRYSVRDVIGPDEYHEHVDNNVFTNWMIRWHLSLALSSLDWLENFDPVRFKTIIKEFEISAEIKTHWQDIQENIIILQDKDSELFEQFEGFFKLKSIDWSKYFGRSTSIQEILGIEETNRYQVIKQADVIMLLCLHRDAFKKNAWKVNWDYYHPITDHTYGSSLSPSFYAWAACEMGYPDEAYKHFIRAARADLFDIRGNAGDGIHAASAGGLWQAIAFGFAGLSFKEDQPMINPRMPAHWDSLFFSFLHRDQAYQVEIGTNGSQIQLLP